MSAIHIPPFDNQNQPIIPTDHDIVPLTSFNIVKLKQGESFSIYEVEYETGIVPVTGTISVEGDGFYFPSIGVRSQNVWDGEPEAAYIPIMTKASFTCLSDDCEVFIAGAKYDQKLAPFQVKANEIDKVQYGSDDTKTHRKIKHILGQKQAGKVGRLLVSELYTVGAGGWSGFPPHRHSQDDLPNETRHNEIYNFRFKPDIGFGMQLWQKEDDTIGEAYHIVDGSSFAFDEGYHPCVVAPGYEMYYFTILGGNSQRPLVQNFQAKHAWQLDTIPGIKDMIAKFK